MSSAVEGTLHPPSYDFNPSVRPGVTDSANINDLVTSESTVAADLPAYPGRRERPNENQQMKEFYYELKKRGKSFAALTIIANGSYSRHMPTFMEGQQITGRVQLMLDKGDPIQSVVISALGQFITGANPGEQLSFVDISQTLWTQTDGEPQNVSTSEGDSSPTTPTTTKFTGKLNGNYTWPFTIDLPKEVVVAYGNRNEPQVFTLPQTFTERHTRASIAYELSVKLVRNKLRLDHRIPAQFGYIPITRPPPFLPHRRLAYQQGTALLGPTLDPDGWHSAEHPIRLQGKIFNARAIHVGCKLFLAKPLSYTRGSIIPLCLRLEGDDAQALDLLSNPKAIVVRLRRRIKYHNNAEKTLDSLAWKDAIDHSQLAVWWPSAEGSEDRHGRLRFVNGEIHLRSDVKPTSAMASFRIEYSVILFPFDAVGIELEVTDALIEEPVDIVTFYAPGPRPRMLAPPGYEADLAVQQENPNTFSMANLGFF